MGTSGLCADLTLLLPQLAGTPGTHHAGSGHRVVQQELGALGAQKALVGLEVPSLQGCPQLQPDQGFQGGLGDL